MPDTRDTIGVSGIVQIRILCSEGCANTPPTVELVKNVAQDLNIPVNIETVLVGTEEQARELRFLGSPTVLVEGSDIEPSARGSLAFGLT
ncbi:MAG: hypothetical protein HY914_22495 [Desulfomonile tiedjei]|nr:hypothetical protein [Desulfomonile tiedjei]